MNHPTGFRTNIPRPFLTIALIVLAAVGVRAEGPSPDKDVTVAIPGAGAMTFRLLPAGRFMMGSPEGEKHGGKDERPVREVVLTKAFHLGIHEVTCAQWKHVMGTLPDDAGDDPGAAVSGVLWEDCQTFIRKLSEQGFGSFRLPTEAEWEYACRAGTTTRFYWGDDPDESAKRSSSGKPASHCWKIAHRK